MRFIGIILILAGLFYAFGKPFFGSSVSGDQVAKTDFYDRSKSNNENRGWQVSKVFLEKESNPLVVQVKLRLENSGGYAGEPLKLLVRIAPIAQNGTTLPAILNQPVTIKVEDDNSISTKEFNIERTGQFKIGAFPIASDNVTIGRPDLEIDRNIVSIDATVLGSAEASGASGWLMGIGFVVLGIIMLSIFRRRKGAPVDDEHNQVFEEELADDQDLDAEVRTSEKTTDHVEPEVQKEATVSPKRKTDVGKSIQWGRDADRD